MRQLLFLAGFFFISAAVADDKLDTKELDKSSTNMSTTTTATDYNSSRSNNINAAVPAGDPVDDENDDEQAESRAQDYNSSRSNTTSAAGEDKAEDACGENHEDCPEPDKAVEYQDGDDYTLRKRPGR